MGIIYSKSESKKFIEDIQKNLKSGLEVTTDLTAGSHNIIQSIDGKTLSGAAYTAGKNLFSELIIPTISRCHQSLQEVETDLSTYISANNAIQEASQETLDEEKLEAKIRESEIYRNTVSATASALSNQAFDLLAMTNPVTAVISLANHLFDVQGKLNRYVESLDQDIEKLKKDLRLLQNFQSQVQGLFNNSLNNFKIAMQSVLVLNNTKVNSDGTYTLPAGVDRSWFTQIKSTESSKVELLEIANRVGMPFKEFLSIYDSLKNSSGGKSFLAIMILMNPSNLNKRKFLDFGLHGEKTFNYLMQDWRSIKKQLRKLDNPAARKLLSSMDGSFNQFLKNIEKLKDFKGISKYTKPLSNYTSWVSNPAKKFTKQVGTKVLKNIKPLGKIAGKAGWAGMAIGVSYDVVTNLNKEKGDTFQKVGKSVVHAGVNQLKSVGPIEGALVGASGGPIGAGIGFTFGTVNAVWGAIHPESKDKFYGAIEKGGDWVVDKIDDVGKSIGKAAQGTWNSVTSFFGGGKYAYD
ncbi:hypothetical protein A5804_000079 [Enterococcus faecium]|uniref:LXG domain-containing protein n=1 Tax=Enterococcus faecium TaxID=1352 RepID=A0AB73N1G2_ENTFC|nr:hypothetical protein [Enterococcus faecium]OTN98596.1 hypothetical protein A5804_000079 [Enterococcus faecium]